MTLEIEIRLKCGGDETTLALESTHLTGLNDTQRHEARRLAKVALDLLAGKTVLRQPLVEHLRD